MTSVVEAHSADGEVGVLVDVGVAGLEDGMEDEMEDEIADLAAEEVVDLEDEMVGTAADEVVEVASGVDGAVATAAAEDESLRAPFKRTFFLFGVDFLYIRGWVGLFRAILFFVLCLCIK